MKYFFLIIAILVFLAFGSLSDGYSQWVQTNGIFTARVNSLAVIDSILFAGAVGGGNSMTSDNGISWGDMTISKPNIFANSFAVRGADLFASTGDSGVFLSTDMGLNWTPLNTGIVSQFSNFILSLGINKANLYAGSWGNGLFISTNNGISWKRNSTSTLINTAIVYTIFVNDSNLIISTNAGNFRSTDNGQSWKAFVIGLANNGATSFASSETGLYAATGKGIFISTDGIVTWTALDSGLTNLKINDLTVRDGYLFAATDSNVFLSTNKGTQWAAITNGLPSCIIYKLAVNKEFLFAGTRDFGVWKRSLSDFGISSVSQPKPSNSSLVSYPNPFSQSVSINFSSDKSAFAQISIHNLLGSEVAQLFSGQLDAGEHSFTWDARGMPPGMYICVIHAEGRTQDLPMMLVK